LPVNSQIRAMAIPFRKNQGAGKVAVRRAKASTISGQNLQNELGFPRGLPLSFGVWTLTCFIAIGP
jgi:hypothetical protein